MPGEEKCEGTHTSPWACSLLGFGDPGKEQEQNMVMIHVLVFFFQLFISEVSLSLL